MCTILVSGASGIIGYGILKSLRQSHSDCRLIATTVYERSAAQAFCDVFEKAPFTSHESYIPWLVEVIEKHEVSLAIPGIETDVVAWNAHRRTIERSGAKVLLNNPELITLCADKWLFYQRLVEKNSSYAIPTSLQYDKACHQFPLLLKPRKGSGSSGITIVESMAALEPHLKDIGPKMILQPVIGDADHEYTTSAFFDRSSRLCAHMTLRRSLSRAGFTENAETVELGGIREALLHLGEIFLPVGPTNFQFRTDNGQLKLLEINPRISSATSIRTAFGYNESAMSVDFYLRNEIPVQPPLRRGHAIRYIEEFVNYDSVDF